MSAVSSSTSSLTGADYATQLAQASALKRSLASIGTAVQNGDLTTASSLLAAFIKANPQYASTSTGSSQSQDPINQDFQSLATAISNNNVQAAQSAWAQVKTDLANDGVTDLNDGTTSTAQIVAQAKESMDSEVLSDMFSASSSNDTSLASLLGGSSDSGGINGVSSSLLGSWLTYQQSGTATPSSTASSTGNILDAAV